MFPIALTVIAWLPALVGWGAIVRTEGDPEVRVPVAGLLGCGFLGVAAVVASFAVPVGPAVSAALWLGGVALAVVRRRWILEGARPLDLVATVVAAFAVARLAWPPQWMHYDTGLYHLQTVHWLREYPVQLGLANLHFRLGFDSLWHATAAALELPFAAGRSVWFANALPIVFAASAGTTALRRLVAGDRSFPNVFLAGILLLAVAALPSFPGLSTDFPAAVFAYLAVALWARALEEPAWPGPDAQAGTLLALFAFLTKISMALLFAAAAAAIVWRWRTVGPRRVRLLAAVAALALAPWLVRNVVLSGCALFPVAATCLPGLGWSYGAERTQQVDDIIHAWARKPFGEPQQVLSDWSWLGGWPQLYSSPDHHFLLALAAAGALCWLVLARRTPRSLAATAAVALAGALLWFFTAPSPRFAYGFLFPLALLPLAFGASQVRWLDRSWARALLAVAILLGARELLARTGVRNMTRTIAIPYRAWPARPVEVAAETRRTRHGLEVRSPTANDQCWDVPIPCTPYFDPDLAWTGGAMEVRKAGAPSPAASSAKPDSPAN